MDHAETTEREGHGPQNEIADNPPLRGNSTKPTVPSMDDLDNGAMGGYHDPIKSESDRLGSMGVDAAEVGTQNTPVDDGVVSAAPEATQGTTVPLMSPLAAPTTGGGPDSRSSQTPDRPVSAAMNASAAEMEVESSLNTGHMPDPQVGSESRGENVQAKKVLETHLSPGLLDALSQEVESSFDQAHELSFDDEDSNDVLSDKASSMDAEQSDHDIPPPQDRSQAGQVSERAPLESAYGPFIHPTDTSLDDARERLHVALEQTRLLRASFTEQAYERYRCVMKPVPDSSGEIIEPIKSDPTQVGVVLREQTKAIKAEKDLEKKQAQQAGVGLEELAYFGEGLHLVILPEDEVDENEIDLAQFPHRGPIDHQTGERRDEISAAAAATTEQVFDRIRRIRAYRMGADIVPAGAAIPGAANQISHKPAKEKHAFSDAFSPGLAMAPPASSPAPSVDSDASSDIEQRPRKDALQHLLTLAPAVEGLRPDGSLTAVQSSLITRGVGMSEMKRDGRVNPLRQRMVQPNYFSPTPAYKFLPPLLGPHQLYRLQPADSRKDGLEVRNGARESIKSVVEEICLAASKGNSLKENDMTEEGSVASVGAADGLRKALGEERGALEISLMKRLHSAALAKQRHHAVKGEFEPTEENFHGASLIDHGNGDFDPLLAYSVMNAVGLVRKKKADNFPCRKASSENAEHAYAQTLGLESLMDLEAVTHFFHSNESTVPCKKRPLPDTDVSIGDAKRPKSEKQKLETGDVGEEAYQIRGGGGTDESKNINSSSLPEETSGTNNGGMSNGVPNTKNQAGAPKLDPALAAFARFDPRYNAMSQVPHSDKQNQNVIAAAASRQLLQRQLGIPPDPYRAATLAHQLNGPIGSHLNSLSADLSDFYLRSGLAGNSDWSALQAANAATRPDILAQHPQLANSLGLLHGQMNLALSDQEAARAMLLREHHNAATARAHGAVTAAAAAHYQAALSTINQQNPFGLVASSLTQLRSTESQPMSSAPALNEVQEVQRKGLSTENLQHKRSSSLSEKVLSSHKSTEETKDNNNKNPVAELKRPASAPPSPPSIESSNKTTNGKSVAKDASNTIVSRADVSSTVISSGPAAPAGLHKEIADLISDAKFHEALTLHQKKSKKSDGSESLLVRYLLSLSAWLPIPNETIANAFTKKLRSSNYQLRLHEIVGNSSTATRSRDVLIAIISVWIWHEHKDTFKHFDKRKNADPSNDWLVNLAIDKSLTAVATYFDRRPSGKNDAPSKDATIEHIAATASQSLSAQVFVDKSADASFPIIDDLLKLLDSLRTNALQAKTQERVLLATMASRCGNLSEAFSNAYASSIVRAGVALGHENVCELGQDEECKASTMLPYDFFHDNVGVWEEPCRPPTGYHSDVGGDELKKQAHARSMIQKSMLKLQSRLGLKGGISDGGPYFTLSLPNPSAPSTPTAVPTLLRTPSGNLNRRGSFDGQSLSGTGPSDTLFNPDHDVVPMIWNPDDISNLPYGLYQPLEIQSTEDEKKAVSVCDDGKPDGNSSSFPTQHRSTEELEWEDVANMFFHGGSTRNLDINYDFGSSDHLGKKTIFAPFVREFERSTLELDNDIGDDPSSEEDVGDDIILQRHQHALRDMKLKLDSVLENRKQPPQQRGRKR